MVEATAEVKKTQEEKDADLQKRVEAFNGELIPLLGKYQVGLGATAYITPDGRIAARPTLFDAPAEKPAEDPKPAEPAPAPTAPLADSAV